MAHPPRDTRKLDDARRRAAHRPGPRGARHGPLPGQGPRVARRCGIAFHAVLRQGISFSARRPAARRARRPERSHVLPRVVQGPHRGHVLRTDLPDRLRIN